MNPTVRRFLVTVALTLFPAAALAALSEPDESAPRYEAILKVDAHSHVFEDHPDLHALFRRINFRTVNVCVNVSDDHFERMHEIAFDLYRQHPALYPFESTFDLRQRDAADYTKNVIAWLGRTFARGAVGVKIWKDVGLVIKRPDGSFALPDDPLWDPIYAYVAQQGKVLHAHLGEPREAWLPLDQDSPHYNYYSRRSEYHFYGKPEYPSHAAIIAARDRIMEKHPTLVVLGAHLGSLEYDLEMIARRLDQYPNFYVEVSARIKDLARHRSDKVRAFMIKYQDRILYGLDAGWQPYLGRQGPTDAQRKAHLNMLELRYHADYDYFAGKGELTYDHRKVEALNLPRHVLEKFYRRNAIKLFKLDAAGQGEK
ncbi:MAG: amidohydrolase family protein [Verrucomicrobia bacterium]|nr:amidohydrolase family protein [Verrucomicrobiota bacterium]